MARGRPLKAKKGKSKIIALFDGQRRRVSRRSQLARLLDQLKVQSEIAQNTTTDTFISFLQTECFLKTITLAPLTDRGAFHERFIWRESSAFEVALSLQHGSYLTHGSAVFLHSLTDQLPQTIYVNYEQTPKPFRDEPLTQDDINSAFAAPQRQSQNIYQYDDTRIVLINGKHTKRLEVGDQIVHGVEIDVTKLERTLIDITVRPAYSGGVFQVLEAFQRAKDRISVSTLLATLKKLNFRFPYHQAIGFYMQRAGYEKERYNRLKLLGLDYEFFLAHDLREREYSEEWKLFSPKGF